MLQADINQLPGYNDKLMDARTVAFISLVWSENVRSYTSRSFDRPVWVNILGNWQMQKAIVMAQVCLYLAVLLPGFSDMILGLRGVAVGLYGWALALVGPVGCVVLCEICKLITKMQKQQYQASLEVRQKTDAQEIKKMISQRTGGPTKVKSSAKMTAAAAPREEVAVAAKSPK